MHVGNKAGKRDSTERYGVHFNLLDVNGVSRGITTATATATLIV